MMRACWMFMILLSCRLSRATENQCACREVKIVCVPVGGDVLLPCTKFTGKADTEVVTYHFLRDEEVIYNQTCVHDETKEDPPNCKRDNFTLTGVNASSHGIYRCKVGVTFPPPFRKESSLCILVQVEGHQCKSSKDDDKSETGGYQRDGFLWIWILGLVVLGIYSLIVTIIAGIIWVKWRRSDSQSDYMNTKPKAPRDRKKKRGVQIHIPHHF